MRFSDDWDNMFTARDVDMIKRAAFDVMEKSGMRMSDETLKKRLCGDGFSLTDGRVTISKTLSEKFLDDMIKRVRKNAEGDGDTGDNAGGTWDSASGASGAGDCAGGTRESACGAENGGALAESRLDGWINNYCHSYIDPATGAIHQYDMASLIKMTAFCGRMAKKHRFTPNAAGYPRDVPPSCQAIARYVAGSAYLEHGTYPEPMCRYSAKYLFEMCEVTGDKINSLPVYISTPLTIGDESFHVVMDNHSRIASAHISSMPSFGANTPMSISGGLALVLAERLAGAMIVNRLTGLETYADASLFPFDFKDLSQGFGTPENLMLEFVGVSFNNTLCGTAARGAGAEIHTHSIWPDSQSSAEKAFAMAAAISKYRGRGTFVFRGMGTLGMDEIFSPAQLVIDAELLNYARRLDAGYVTDAIPDDYVDEIREGVLSGFASSERTVSRYRDYMYHSDLFTRKNYQSQVKLAVSAAEKRAAAAATAELKIEPVRWLAPVIADELDRLLERAVENAH
jgi:trimethylamine:corrinoid methyltransferase-like protein